MSYGVHLVILFCVYAMTALGTNALLGYLGLLSLAQAGVFAVGGYSYALLMRDLSWSGWQAFGGAVLVGALVSPLLALPSCRFREEPYVLTTLAVGVFISSTLHNWIELTEGPYGIANIRPPTLGGALNGDLGMAILALVCMLATMLLCYQWFNSPWGRLLKAIRDDEAVVRGLGKPTVRIKAEAALVASVPVALAGAIYTAHVGYINPQAASLDAAIVLLAMLVIGGAGTVWGPLAGAAVYVMFPELLRLLHVPTDHIGNLRTGLMGLLLVAIVHWRPQGIAGEYRVD